MTRRDHAIRKNCNREINLRTRVVISKKHKPVKHKKQIIERDI